MDSSFKKAIIRATYDKRKLHREILKLHSCAKEMECILDKMFPNKKEHQKGTCPNIHNKKYKKR